MCSNVPITDYECPRHVSMNMKLVCNGHGARLGVSYHAEDENSKKYIINIPARRSYGIFIFDFEHLKLPVNVKVVGKLYTCDCCGEIEILAHSVTLL